MAKHIYVSSVIAGGATGDQSYSTRQTGNITALTASNVYDTLYDAIIGATPIDGDFVYIADNHAANYAMAASVYLNTGGSNTGVGLTLASVDNTSIADYKPGASEVNTSDYDVYPVYKVNISGLSLKGADNTIAVGTSGTTCVIQDCKLSNGGGLYDIACRAAVDGALITLNNVELIGTSATSEFFEIAFAGKVIWNGGKVSGTMPGHLILNFGTAGGATMIMNGVDISALTSFLIPTLSAGSADHCLLRLNSCLINSSLTLPSMSTLGDSQQRFEMFNTDDTSDAYHRFLIVDGAGVAQNSDSVFVTANPGFNEETDKSSIQVKTSAQCSHALPFVFELPARYVDLSDAGVSDTISVNIVTDFALTDTEIAFFLMYPDGTTQVQANWISSGKNVGTDPYAAGNYGTDPLAAGSALNTTGALAAGDWTGEPASPTFYKVNLDTVGDAGAACAPTIRIEVYKPSIAGTTGSYLYVDPVLAVGT